MNYEIIKFTCNLFLFSWRLDGEFLNYWYRNILNLGKDLLKFKIFENYLSFETFSIQRRIANPR